MVFINCSLLSHLVPLGLLWQEIVIVGVGGHFCICLEASSIFLYSRMLFEKVIGVEMQIDVDRAG